ncbi:MAG: hypothetical protein Q4E50_02620 [Tissierellia bacterium]|nr:hypothetical protein [Tissierellia bacterium]
MNKIRKIFIPILAVLIIFAAGYSVKAENYYSNDDYLLEEADVYSCPSKDCDIYYRMDKFYYVSGKMSGDWFELDNGDGYLYKPQIIRGSFLSEYSPATLNVRKSPNGEIIGTVEVLDKIEGIRREDGWIAMGVDSWIYDLNISYPEDVRGYLLEDTDIMSLDTRDVIGTARKLEHFWGVKVGDYIVNSHENKYIYDIGLHESEYVAGYLPVDTNLISISDGKVIKVIPKLNWFTGEKVEEYIISEFGETYIYDPGLTQGEWVNGYLDQDVDLISVESGEVINVIPKFSIVYGQKVGEYIIEAESNNYFYDSGIYDREDVYGYLHEDSDVFSVSDGNVIKTLPKFSIYDGYKIGKYLLNFSEDEYIYDPGITETPEYVNGILFEDAQVWSIENENEVKTLPKFARFSGERIGKYIVNYADNEYIIDDSNFVQGEPVWGFLLHPTNARSLETKDVIEKLPKYTKIDGIKIGQYVYESDNGRYLYDFGIERGEYVSGFLLRETNFRFVSNGEVALSKPKYSKVSGYRLGKYIVSDSYDCYFYDFGIDPGEYVSGYLLQKTNIRSIFSGDVVDSAPKFEKVEGYKVGKYIVDDYRYFYDFGLAQGEYVVGFTPGQMNVRKYPNGPIVKKVKAMTKVEGILNNNWIAMRPNEYIYDSKISKPDGKVVLSYSPSKLNVRKYPNGPIVRQIPTLAKVEGILKNNWIKIGVNEYVYDLKISNPEYFNGYILADTNLRSMKDKKIIKKLPKFSHIEGFKYGDYIVYRHDYDGYEGWHSNDYAFEDTYLYNFGVSKGRFVHGYLPTDVNVRKYPNGPLRYTLPTYLFVEGVRDGNWIALGPNEYFYSKEDLITFNGVHIKIVTKPTNVWSLRTGKVVRVIGKSGKEYFEGVKFGNKIVTLEGEFIYVE